MDYLELLNPPQRQAVEHTDGPIMIIAGAGSGKTRVLTYRIAHLLQKGVDPFNILSLTFTNKAASEMRERISQVVGPEARNLWMGTFHSVFARILRSEADRLGYPSNFTIYDTDDSKSLIKSIINELALDDKLYKPSVVLNRISNAKNNLISVKAYLENTDLMEYDKATGRPRMGEVYETYQKRCFRAGAMDFDDLLFKTNDLLKDHADVLNKYQQLFHYVMVDEFQDTNISQYNIVKRLASVRQNICVVGDDAQSIYAFRGATIKNILNFNQDYPDLQVFKLEQNYRSTQNIVNAAGSVIANNRDQIKKEVWTENGEGEKIKVLRGLTDNEEGKLVGQAIFEARMKDHLNNRDFAILYRTNAQSRAMEEALRKLNIDYKVYGGVSFYQRKEVKDLLAYFRIVINPLDEEALKRVINYPTRGIGKTSLERMMVEANENGMPLWEVIDHVEHYNIPTNAHRPIREFRDMIKSFATMLNTHNAYDLGIHIAKSSGILKLLYDDKTVEGITRFENIEELLNGVKAFVEEEAETAVADEPKNLSNYMQDIALLTDADREKDDGSNDRVTLMTIHSAKGLEFPHVFVVGLEENLFPSQMALNSRSELEEERRLFYVAITRAMKRLTLSYATSRFRFGTLSSAEPSRFIDEIEPKYLDRDYYSGASLPEADSYQSPFGSRAFGKARKKPVGRSNTSSRGLSSFSTNRKPPPPANPNFVPDDTSGLTTGMQVEHQRFGTGAVLNVEGQHDDRRATIEFDKFGKKMIVLKFAKLKIVS